MPIVQFTEQDRFIVDLALTIDDPAGVEAIELAQTILEVFRNRQGRQAELMRESLHRWALQWPRPSATHAARGATAIHPERRTSLTADEPLCRDCSWPESLCCCSIR